MEIAKDATSRHLASTSYFASGGATPLECRIFMDRFQKDLRFQERIRMCLKSPDLKSWNEDDNLIRLRLSFIKIQNPPVSLSSASPLGFIAQAWWMWLPQEHLTPEAGQRFKHATQLQLLKELVSTNLVSLFLSLFLSPAPSSLSISEGTTLARGNSMQQHYPTKAVAHSSSGANPTRQCKVVKQF